MDSGKIWKNLIFFLGPTWNIFISTWICFCTIIDYHLILLFLDQVQKPLRPYVWLVTKEDEIPRRDKWRGPPYHMIIHALQTRYSIWKLMLSLTVCIQKRLLCTLNRGKSRLNIAKQRHFFGCKKISNTNVFFYIIKISFIYYGIVKNYI